MNRGRGPQRRKGMKRGKPLDRGAPLKRSKPMPRGRGPKRRRPPSLPPKERIAAQEFYRHTMRLCDQRCAVTGEKWAPRAKDDPLRLEAHHVVTKQELKKRGLEHLMWDAANGLAITAEVHDAHHHSPNGRIPRSKLTERNLRWAKKHHLMDFIDRTYPE